MLGSINNINLNFSCFFTHVIIKFVFKKIKLHKSKTRGSPTPKKTVGVKIC